MERRVCYRCVGDIARGRRVGEYRVDMSLDHVGRWEGEGRRELREENQTQSQEANVQRQGWVTSMARLYKEESLREGQPRLWAGEFRGRDEVCQPNPCNKEGLGGAGKTWRSGPL